MIEGIQIKVIAYALAFAALAYGAWRTAVYFEDVGYQRAVNVYEAKLTRAALESRAKERDLQARVDESERKGAEREKIHRVERAVLESRVIGLRDDIATFRARLPKAAGAACVEAADTAAELFGECVEEYQRVAWSAQGHVDDVKTLMEGWPK